MQNKIPQIAAPAVALIIASTRVSLSLINRSACVIAEIPTVSEYNIAVKKHILENLDDLVRFIFKFVTSKVMGKFQIYMYDELINRAVASSVSMRDITNRIMNLAVQNVLFSLFARGPCFYADGWTQRKFSATSFITLQHYYKLAVLFEASNAINSYI